LLCMLECGALALAWRNARRRADRFLEAAAALCLVSLPVAVLALAGIRGTVAPHHTAWISALGLVGAITAAAGLLPAGAGGSLLRHGHVRLIALAGALLALAAARPIAIIPQAHRNPEVAVLGDAVSRVSARAAGQKPTLLWNDRGKTADQAAPAVPWAVGLLLEMEKRQTPVAARASPGLTFALGNARWQDESRSGPTLELTAGSFRQGQPLVCIEDGPNYLVSYPVCVWPAD
jgi:hypothetical protein